jgi:uncharacterized protein
MSTLFLVLIVFFSASQQTVTGFGFSLILMPIATILFGLKTAAPLVALQGLTLYIVNLYRYHERVVIAETLPLALAAMAGVPLGIWALVSIDATVIKILLGLILMAYAVYTLLKPTGFFLRSKYWGLAYGLVAGGLGGAYNTPGPVVVLYGTLRKWPKEEFRASLQVIFFLTGSLTVISHFLGNRLTEIVITPFLVTSPALLLGVLAGAWVDGAVNRDRFRTIITVMILLLGVSLIAEAFR